MSEAIKNTSRIGHMCRNGTYFEAARADLAGGVTVRFSEYGKRSDEVLADFAEFGAWHCSNIHPHLNGFGGYDNIRFNLEGRPLLRITPPDGAIP